MCSIPREAGTPIERCLDNWPAARRCTRASSFFPRRMGEGRFGVNVHISLINEKLGILQRYEIQYRYAADKSGRQLVRWKTENAVPKCLRYRMGRPAQDLSHCKKCCVAHRFLSGTSASRPAPRELLLFAGSGDWHSPRVAANRAGPFFQSGPSLRLP